MNYKTLDIGNSKILDIGLDSMNGLTIFFFILAGNYVSDIYSCELRKFLTNNMLVKHIVAFNICLVFVGLSSDKHYPLKYKILKTFFVYIWFIIVMRAPKIITIITMMLITIIYILKIHSDDLKKQNNLEEKKKIDDINKKLLVASVFFSIIGTITFMYIVKKKYKTINFYKFFLGMKDKKCFADDITQLERMKAFKMKKM
jgi:uncharacterized membrane protein